MQGDVNRGDGCSRGNNDTTLVGAVGGVVTVGDTLKAQSLAGSQCVGDRASSDGGTALLMQLRQASNGADVL